MNVAFNAAWCVVGKALAPVADTALEAWAASKDLGQNVETLKMELLYVQAMLRPTLGWEVDNPALRVLLDKLRDLAYNAEDVLDELDYFRIQDELEGTSEAADEHAKGCARNLVLNVHHTAKAVGKLLRQHACSGTGSTIGSIGKCLPCSSMPSVHGDENDDNHSGMLNMPKRKYADGAPKLVFNRVGVSKRMKSIVEQLRPTRKEVSEILRTLGSTQNNSPAIAQSRPNTTSESIEPKLYGRDRMMNNVDDITQGKYCGNNLTVIPIVGPGGIGKTTLTQYIYQNQKVQNHFQVKIWICVSVNFNVDKLTEDIVKLIPDVKDEKVGTSGELIGQRLKSKRFLLILDDMWQCGSDDEWKRLLLPFKKSQEKSNIIIVTTRFPAIAETVKLYIDRPIELKGLDREEFKELFLAFVFSDDQSREEHMFLLETGDKIVDKLNGSPLAAKTVGRLLRNHLNLDHWTRVLESKDWESAKSDHDILPSLKLSYDYLPYHLQQCFSYCALFPEDYEFDGEELIHFWIGLDILHPGDQSRKIEDIGLINLNDLVSYGFFKKEEKDGHTKYLIHDLLHDLAVNVASYECLVIDRSSLRSIEIIQPSVRHLCVIMDYEDRISDGNYITKFRTLQTRLKIENLRTLMIFGAFDESFGDCFGDLIRKANCLRVLYLSNMIPHMEFAALPHLWYLRQGSTSSREIHLPRMLSRFYHLKILDLETRWGSLILPKDMSNLTKLRHFISKDDRGHSKICNVGKMHFLQELKRFKVNKEGNGFELKQLGSLIEPRELGIYNLEKIHTKEEATAAQLLDKIYLHKLTLDWHIEVPRNERDAEGVVLESLQPGRNLQELCIRGHGSRSCPTWLSSKLSVKALKSLCLDGIDWDALPWLGHMLMLHELTLKSISTLKEFRPSHFGTITEQNFCNLNKLALIKLEVLQKWDLGETCHLFSRLKVLIITDCPELMGLPFADNICYPPRKDEEWKIHWFPNLQKFETVNCPKVVSLPPIPWTKTLCSVKIHGVRSSSQLHWLEYSKSSSRGELRITGKAELHSQDEVLVFSNLPDLQDLSIRDCPPLELKHLQMLTSLKRLKVGNSHHVFVPPESEGGVQCQLPVEFLRIDTDHATGKELSHPLSHFPKLSELVIRGCEKITQLGVQMEQKQTPTPLVSTSSSSSWTVNGVYRWIKTMLEVGCTQATVHGQQQIALLEAEGAEKVDEDELLFFPAHLSESLQKLTIRNCPELILVDSPRLDHYEAGGVSGAERRGGEGAGLQALLCLRELKVNQCPKCLSAYETSSPSFCCPFPSSLQDLELFRVGGMETLDPLSNLTSLTRLYIDDCGEDLRGEGLWTLLTHSQLSELNVFDCPKFFVGWDPMRGLQDEGQEQLPRRSPKLRKLWTDDITGVLAKPICTLLSSSLTELSFWADKEAEYFTQEQEEALQQLTSLEDLRFERCPKLQCLPAGLHTRPSLKKLAIWDCPAISSLPKDGLPISLQVLKV